MSDKCVAGCKIYSGHERYHHKNCPYYPESFSRRFDQLQAENEQCDDVIESLQWDIDEYLKGTLEATLRTENKRFRAENKQLRVALKSVCSRCQRETVLQALKGAAKPDDNLPKFKDIIGLYAERDDKDGKKEEG